MPKSLYACDAIIYRDKPKTKKKNKKISGQVILISTLIAIVQIAIYIGLEHIPNPAIGLVSILFFPLTILGTDIIIYFTSSKGKLRNCATISGIIFAVLILASFVISILN